jgi:hypothetical protein
MCSQALTIRKKEKGLMTTRKLFTALATILLGGLALSGLRTPHQPSPARPQVAVQESTISGEIKAAPSALVPLDVEDAWNELAGGARLTQFIQASRLTVTQVNRQARSIRSVDASGIARWVPVDGPTAALERLNPGDIISVELRDGRAYKMVVLRRAWEEIASLEN